MLDHIEDAADRLREDILRHVHVDRDRGYFTPDARPGYDPDMFVAHPLDPHGAGGKLALFVVEALCLILRSQHRMQDQLNRLNSVIDSIASRVGNVKTDLEGLIAVCQAHVAGDSELDVGAAADRLQAMVDRLDTIDQAITHANSPEAQAQTPSVGPTATATGTAGSGVTGDATNQDAPAAEPTAGGTATGDGTELAPQ